MRSLIPLTNWSRRERNVGGSTISLNNVCLNDVALSCIGTMAFVLLALRAFKQDADASKGVGWVFLAGAISCFSYGVIQQCRWVSRTQSGSHSGSSESDSTLLNNNVDAPYQV